MSKPPDRRLSPAGVYRLARELVRFRYLIETEYASVDAACDTHTAMPEVVEHGYSSIAEIAEPMKRQAGDEAVLEGVVTEAKEILKRFRAVWMDAEHRDRRDSRVEVERHLEPGPRFRLDWLTLASPLAYGVSKLPPALGWPDDPSFTRLAFTRTFNLTETAANRSGSPFEPAGWQSYEAAQYKFREGLCENERSLFELGRRLAECRFPIPSSFDAGTGCPPVFDTDYLVGVVVPEIAADVRTVQRSSGLLAGIEPHLEGPEFRFAAIRLDDTIRGALPGTPATRPRWDKRTGELFSGEPPAFIARFAKQAKGARKWLDLFEQQGWPESVIDPAGKPNKRRDACRTLNGKQTRLEFFPVDDQPKGMGYRPLPVANSRADA